MQTDGFTQLLTRIPDHPLKTDKGFADLHHAQSQCGFPDLFHMTINRRNRRKQLTIRLTTRQHLAARGRNDQLTNQINQLIELLRRYLDKGAVSMTLFPDLCLLLQCLLNQNRGDDPLLDQ